MWKSPRKLFDIPDTCSRPMAVSEMPVRSRKDLPVRDYLVEILRDARGREQIRAHRGTNRDVLSPGCLGAYIVRNATNKAEAIATVATTSLQSVTVEQVA